MMKKSLLVISLTAAVIFANVANSFALDPQPEPPRECPLIKHIDPGTLVSLDPQPEPPVFAKIIQSKSIAVR